MSDPSVFRIPYAWSPASLAWEGDELVDWVGGGRRWLADGTEVASQRGYGYAFDRALASPSGRFSVLFCERRTKGLVLDQGAPLREIDRSFYQADSYAYPIALGRLPDGREVIAHCPDAYNVLQIEMLDSGERLTTREVDAQDVFHSRLSFSPDGRFLLSAGWIWHPWNCFGVFDVERALSDPGALDRAQGHFGALQGAANGGEVKSACWLNSAQLVVTNDLDGWNPAAEAEGDVPPASGIWNARDGGWIGRSASWNPQATLHRCGDGVVYVEDGRPHWWSPGLESPLAWPDVAVAPMPGETPRQGIVHDRPFLAAHPTKPRFVAVTETEIVVVDLAIHQSRSRTK